MALRHGVRGVRVAAARLAGPGRAALAAGAPRAGGRAAWSLRAFDGAFPAAGDHGGWGGPRWLSTEATASALERPGSESGAGLGWSLFLVLSQNQSPTQSRRRLGSRLRRGAGSSTGRSRGRRCRRSGRRAGWSAARLSARGASA